MVKAFLEHPTYTMVELAELPELKVIKVARKTIPKYLNDPVIINLLGAETYNRIQKLLKENQEEIKNRRLSNLKYVTVGDDKQQQEQKDKYFLVLTLLQLRNPDLSIEELTKLYNESNGLGEQLSVDYVRACLSNKSKEDNISLDQIHKK